MWLTSAGWVCRGAAAVIVTVAFCVLCCFEMQKSFELQEKRGSLWNRESFHNQVAAPSSFSGNRVNTKMSDNYLVYEKYF